MTDKMEIYFDQKRVKTLLRLPLQGNLDLTYRCNNNCRHCWLRKPPNAVEKKDELSFDEIIRIINDARSLGCREWFISGGEPMLRADFPEIFKYIMAHSISYSLNTNGTLITSQIACLMKKRGRKMVSIYGADKEIHDWVTRCPGSFEKTMQGLKYLREAGAGFTIQLVLMKDNVHQREKMISLAESLTPSWRFGADWLFLSSCRDRTRNREIIRQRLPASTIVEMNQEDFAYDCSRQQEMNQKEQSPAKENKFLFQSCIESKQDFSVDPFGRMTFCSFIKDPKLMFDLRKGSFREGWDVFLPSLVHKTVGGSEYRGKCGSCRLRNDCRWCPVFGYLERGRYQAKISFLCDLAKKSHQAKRDWARKHRRFYEIAGITLQVESDLPINGSTFHPKFKFFEAAASGKNVILIHHHFTLPRLADLKLSSQPIIRPPWAIYQTNQSWVYLCIGRKRDVKEYNQVAIFNRDFTDAKIFLPPSQIEFYKSGQLDSLTLLPTDQLLLAQVLADRNGCYFHSSGLIFEGNGLLFMGHSGAGKSTATKLLRDQAEILCDDRIILRKHEKLFQIYGTWNHGEIPLISASSAPLKGIFFLKQAKKNSVSRIENSRDITRELLSFVIRPTISADWWRKTLGLIDEIVSQVPCYVLRFQKNAPLAELLRDSL